MSTTPLITLEEFKQYLDMNSGVTNYDSRIEVISAQATKQLEQFTRQKFTKAARTEYFGTYDNSVPELDLAGTSRDGYYDKTTPRPLLLGSMPVDSSADFSLKYDPYRRWDEVEDVSEDAYFVDYDNGKVILEFATVASLRSIKVEYTGGYASSGSPATLSDSAPEDLKLACLAQSYFLFDKLHSQSFGIEAQSGSDGKTYRKQDGILCHEAMRLAQPYRRIGISG